MKISHWVNTRDRKQWALGERGRLSLFKKKQQHKIYISVILTNCSYFIFASFLLLNFAGAMKILCAERMQYFATHDTLFCNPYRTQLSHSSFCHLVKKYSWNLSFLRLGDRNLTILGMSKSTFRKLNKQVPFSKLQKNHRLCVRVFFNSVCAEDAQNIFKELPVFRCLNLGFKVWLL